MNLFINDPFVDKIGGVEVLFIEVAEYLSSIGHKVFFIVCNIQSIYLKNLKNKENIFFVYRLHQKAPEYYSNKELQTEKTNIISQLISYNVFHDECTVISPYFHHMQFAIAMFGDLPNFKLTQFWGHPLNWIGTLSRKSIKSLLYLRKKTRNKKYFYQKKLLEILSASDANYFGARCASVLNSWYYDVNLNQKKIETLPIGQSLKCFKNHDNFKKKDSSPLKVLWVGRFDSWKNEAIIHIHKVLEQLSEDYQSRNVAFSIAGYGSDKHTDYVKKNIIPRNVKVNFLGFVNPKDLQKIFLEYDIGIAMGLTVKKMAQVGLPSILIDSFYPNIPYDKNVNWIFDTKEGDSGDGFYFSVVGLPISNRENLYDLLKKVFDDPAFLTDCSKKSRDYTVKYYSFDKQVMALLNFSLNSKFAGKNYPIYRRNCIICLFYRFYRALLFAKKYIINPIKRGSR